MLMLKQAFAAFVLLAVMSGPAIASGQRQKGPPRQPETSDEDSNDRARRGPALQQPMYAPPAYAMPAPAAGRIIVLTEGQKRCGVRRGCELDSSTPCPPCW